MTPEVRLPQLTRETGWPPGEPTRARPAAPAATRVPWTARVTRRDLVAALVAVVVSGLFALASLPILSGPWGPVADSAAGTVTGTATGMLLVAAFGAASGRFGADLVSRSRPRQERGMALYRGAVLAATGACAAASVSVSADARPWMWVHAAWCLVAATWLVRRGWVARPATVVAVTGR